MLSLGIVKAYERDATFQGGGANRTRRKGRLALATLLLDIVLSHRNIRGCGVTSAAAQALQSEHHVSFA
jgi:hypothetical protein